MKRMVIENADLAWLPEIGLVCFLLGFAFVIFRIAMMSKDKANDLAQLPLEEVGHE